MRTVTDFPRMVRKHRQSLGRGLVLLCRARLGSVVLLAALVAGEGCTFERRPDRLVAGAAAVDTADVLAGVRDSVRQVLDSFQAALVSADTAAALALLDSALVVYEGGAVDSTRDAYAAQHLPAGKEFLGSGLARAVLSQEIEVYGGVAVARALYRVSGEVRGQPLRSETAETMVLVRRPGGWKIRHIHWSSRRLEVP